MSIKEDPLPLVRLTSFIDLFPKYSTYIRIVAVIIFSLLFLAHMFGIYMQYFHENHQDMNVLCSLGAYLGVIYLPYYSQSFTRLKTSLVLLQDSFKSLKSEGPKTYECILRKFKWIKWLHTVTFILIFAATFAASFTDLAKDISTLNAIVAISGKWHPLMHFLLIFISFVITYAAGSLVAINNYMSFNIGAQFALLQHFIKRTLHIKCDIYNTRQQEKIYESLKEFVERYNTALFVSVHFMERVTSIIMIEFLPGVTGFASLTYLVINGNFNYFLLIFPIAWIAVVGNFPLVGQIVNDESSRIFDVMYDCPWYEWNVKNRKTLLIILTNVKEPTTLHFMKLISLDYSFIIKFYRMSYAIMTCILNMKN